MRRNDLEQPGQAADGRGAPNDAQQDEATGNVRRYPVQVRVTFVRVMRKPEASAA